MPMYRKTMNPTVKETPCSPLLENPIPSRKKRRKPIWKRMLWYTLGGIGGAIFLLYFYLFITA